MNNKIIGGVIVVVVLVGGYMLLQGGGDGTPTVAPAPTPVPTPTPTPTPTPAPATSLEVTLAEQNDSGESGNATILDVGGQAQVTLNLANGPSTPQPTHIHEGSCADLGGIVYPLSATVDGESETSLDVSLSDLFDQFPLVINVHKSADEAGTYVACGELEG